MFRAAVVTASDRGAAGEREDVSGQAAERILAENGYAPAGRRVLPDDRALLARELRRLCDGGLADLVLTTGGTGLSPRDVTPEATLDVADRQVPGLAEAMRAYGMTLTRRAMLSRGVCVIRKRTLIVNLPGSPKAVRENLEYLLDVLPHALSVLRGEVEDCAVPDHVNNPGGETSHDE